LNDFGLYRAGSKVVISLFKPDTHLTSACWRDFSGKMTGGMLNVLLQLKRKNTNSSQEMGL
jgi:hypothetical protein